MCDYILLDCLIRGALWQQISWKILFSLSIIWTFVFFKMLFFCYITSRYCEDKQLFFPFTKKDLCFELNKITFKSYITIPNIYAVWFKACALGIIVLIQSFTTFNFWKFWRQNIGDIHINIIIKSYM